jgi:hypothetical protein
MKTIAIIIIALAMTSCTKYKMHFGKACTPEQPRVVLCLVYRKRWNS